ncbi:glycoside hydrolase [Kineosporia sp. NBRC 101731]|uniref:glycoside hydrolase n=1 Tax=Kineosporia sp. NBRC 101731 TaxID=3032199 RepID=UPI0024A003FD|nr:glycoside hydrolase [Kineosporia sp. NBRC 101731]GLY29732.1 hypothetical protein Kisp02_30970 [Kineosporia sp. NBRC 101731]
MSASAPPPRHGQPARRRAAVLAAGITTTLTVGLGIAYTQTTDSAAGIGMAATTTTTATSTTAQTAAAASTSTGCTAKLTPGKTWPDRYNSTVTITGAGTWTAVITMTAPQKVSTVWNGTASWGGGSGDIMTVKSNGSGKTFGFTTQYNGNTTAQPKITSCTATTSTSTTSPTTTQKPATTTTTPAAAADLTVKTGTKYQTIDGFGSAVSIWGSAWSAAETQTLFGTGAQQLGQSIVRTGISPVPSEWANQVSALKSAEASGSNVKILATPWTAPAAWKTNNSRINGGKLKTEYYDDYANHLNDYVSYMKSRGVSIDVVSIQNEPDWHPDYDAMDWSATELKNFVRDQGAKIKNTQLMVAESLNMDDSLTDPLLKDATARNNIGYIGGHLYGAEDAGHLKAYGLADQYQKPVWMTEWNYHKAASDTSTAWSQPGNQAVWDETLDDVMRTVHKSMEANWSAYIWWYGKRYYSFIGDGNAGTTTGAPLKRGYAFSQYAKYVRPGDQRVAVSQSSKASALEVTAYQGSGKIKLVILNRSTKAISNAVIQAPQTVSKAEDYLTSRTANAASQTAGINGQQVTVDVPARSISTVILSQ